MKRTLLLTLLLIGPGCQRAPERSEHVDRLLGTMNARLSVMHDVARWKWANEAPIEDPEREAALLRDVAAKGLAFDLDPAVTRAFFEAQIEAAKVVQRAYFRRWEAGEPLPEDDMPDLKGEIRREIDSLNRALVEMLRAALPRLPADDHLAGRLKRRAEEVLTAPGVDAEARTAALRSLIGVAEKSKPAGAR